MMAASRIRMWEEMWFKTTAEDGERGAAWRAMEDCSTDERLRQETLCHRQQTDEYVECPMHRCNKCRSIVCVVQRVLASMMSVKKMQLMWWSVSLTSRKRTLQPVHRFINTIVTFVISSLSSSSSSSSSSLFGLHQFSCSHTCTIVPLSPSSVIWYRPKRQEGNVSMWERCVLPPT